MTSFQADDVAVQTAFGVPEDPQGPFGAPEPAQPPESASEPDEKPAEEAVPEFDPKYREPFTGLLYIGALTDSTTLFGHHFTISTPTTTERLQIGQVIAPYQGTVTGELAYQTALVAAYLVSIDGTKLPEPVLSNPKETALHDRFRWVTENLRRPVIEELFDWCLRLDSQVEGALSAMGKARG